MSARVDSLWSQQFIPLAVFSICLYAVSVAIHRLYLSPLAKFPGPKLVALTYGVEQYYDIVKRGQYAFEIIKMHEKYGPIVRISPAELHVNDPDYFDEVFPGFQRATDKAPSAASAFGNSSSIISTIPHHLHKMRRSSLNPFFSQKSVIEYAGSIQICVDKLCTRLEELGSSKSPIDLKIAFSALTGDVISLYGFGKAYDCLDDPDFAPKLYRGTSSGGELALLLMQFPWIFPIANLLPYWLVARMDGNVADLLERRSAIESQVQDITSGKEKRHKKEIQSPTVFHELFNSDVPASERSAQRLVDEGITLIGAGTVTTAHVLSTTVYHTLANPSILRKLQKELQEFMPDRSSNPNLVQVERLPYLTAVVKEGLRITGGMYVLSQSSNHYFKCYVIVKELPLESPLGPNPVSELNIARVLMPSLHTSFLSSQSHRNADQKRPTSVHRSQRIAPDRSLRYQNWTIPPGTIVSMTGYMNHINPTIFPAPEQFRPERWLKDDDPSTKVSTAAGPLEKYLLPWGKGTRICLGMNLAYAELYLALAAVFRRFDLELFETSGEDVKVVHDFIFGAPRLDSKGVRVVVKGLRG
ncbi:hypothetical protein MMC11_000185 [Xylographa trunciseda]|nr:hypothetical protein [Xylographa trunciseda]